MTRRKAAIGALVFLGALLVAGYLRLHAPVEVSSEEFLMDTLVSIKVYGSDRETLREGASAAFAEMRRIAELADTFPKPGTPAALASDVCRINENAGKEPVRVHADTMAMLALAKRYHEASGGAVDVTVGPLMKLWGFGGEHPSVPDPARLKKTLPLIDAGDLVLDRERSTAFLRRSGMKLDLGAVAKGYATEKALKVLAGRGIEQALIDAGGNIRVLGPGTRSYFWNIGIKDPRREGGVVAVMKLRDASAVTSGDYHRGFEVGGKRYHHILDPKTGYPAGHSASVTVIAKDAGVADALSTALFVLPPDQALALAEKLGVEVVLVAADGGIRHSASLTDRIETITAGSDAP